MHTGGWGVLLLVLVYVPSYLAGYPEQHLRVKSVFFYVLSQQATYLSRNRNDSSAFALQEKEDKRPLAKEGERDRRVFFRRGIFLFNF